MTKCVSRMRHRPLVRFTRSAGNITMDCDDLERIDLVALGGADTVEVKSLVATDVVEVNVDLAAEPAGETGDAALDHVLVDATDGADLVSLSGNGTSASVRGLSALIHITGAEIANDALTINALAGDDVVETEVEDRR